MPNESSAQFSGSQDRTLAVVVRATLHNKGFVACTALLVIFTVVFYGMVVRGGYTFRKLALPLRAPLHQLSQERLAPYKLLKAIELQSDILNQLGTTRDNYVQWILQEPDSLGQPGQGRALSLFVTYYTGMPDAVPHIPDTCYAGSGHERISDATDDDHDYQQRSASGCPDSDPGIPKRRPVEPG